MKTYNAPALVEYGQVGALTGIFGSDMTQDQSFDPNGKVISSDPIGGSIDQCATGNNVNCL
ncbi:MAG: hypothetical protein Rubg2KO_41250 [Rubricoccaceae bacterium]